MSLGHQPARQNGRKDGPDGLVQEATEVAVAADLDLSVLVPADLGPLRAFSTTAVSPLDHGDFNLSPTTARRHGTDVDRVEANLRVLGRLCGRPVVRLHQIHSARVIDLDAVGQGMPAGQAFDEQTLSRLARQEADAMVTTRRGLALAILTGDCVPLLFADTRHGVFAAAHSGRLGTQRDIAGAVISAMRGKGAVPADIHVWIGPHICGACYETGEQIADAFARQFPGCSTRTRFGGPGVDLGKAIARELDAAGVSKDHVRDAVGAADTAGRPATDTMPDRPGMSSPHRCCTLEDMRFYSYRGYTLGGDVRRDGRFYTVLVP